MNYTILIADDEPEIRTLLRLYLENENYQIIEAENGKQLNKHSAKNGKTRHSDVSFSTEHESKQTA